MGQNFSSEPVIEKETERAINERFNVAVSSCQGWRLSQEDNHSLMVRLPGDREVAFFGVFDGHGSAKVSKVASEHLYEHVMDNKFYEGGNYERALIEGFLSFDEEVGDLYNAQLAGTTAVCLLISDDTVYCANIGDSRGVASVNCECIPLSYDHKPENPGELRRILEAGGYVLGNRVNGNLALSRAFGDFHYKANSDLPAEQQIVCAYPDVKTIPLNDDVDFLLLACDGIWDVLSSEEVVEFVISRLEQNMEPGLICEQLTTRCLATDYELVVGCDNMTVLLVCYTRNRSWQEYCSDLFNKNTNRLGKPPVQPTSSTSIPSASSSSGCSNTEPDINEDKPNPTVTEKSETNLIKRFMGTNRNRKNSADADENTKDYGNLEVENKTSDSPKQTTHINNAEDKEVNSAQVETELTIGDDKLKARGKNSTEEEDQKDLVEVSETTNHIDIVANNEKSDFPSDINVEIKQSSSKLSDDQIEAKIEFQKEVQIKTELKHTEVTEMLEEASKINEN